MDAENETAAILLTIPIDLKTRVEATADAEGLAVNAWAVRVFEANVSTGEGTVRDQHTEARKLLPLLFEANRKSWFMTYDDAAKTLGRGVPNGTRMIGGVASLLDAAAVLTGLPLIALSTLQPSEEVNENSEVFKNLPELRLQLLNEAREHSFTQTDIANIEAKLNNLFREGKGNKAAWRQIKKTMPRFKDVLI